ncbi:AbiTii domain-containing protein [Psychrobacter glacincola]|uniref:AbiTii domain-containing protein n=1 Tax=Psychrobacter glacincola TaxID=56810 RepID=UPI001918F2F5|nr:hypothetical protein [Psychrobacter glacincola]
MSKRIDEARKVCGSLLDELEHSSSNIDSILMKSKRLARLMRDTDAQTWLDLETRGYPKSFDFKSLGNCLKYAVSSGRANMQAATYYTQSLSTLEANAESDGILMNSFKLSTESTTKVNDFLEQRATEALLTTQHNLKLQYKTNYANSKSLLSSMKSAIHSYVTDTYLAIELGDIAQDIFESAREQVDAFIRSNCPKGAEKVLAINERMQDGTAESLSGALTSCRRLLMDVADSVFPAQEEWKDRQGKVRIVGTEQYKNRLLAYLSELSTSKGSFALLESELEHLASRLDVVYEKTCKGVHVDVTIEEARLTVIHTYLFLGELATFGKKS